MTQKDILQAVFKGYGNFYEDITYPRTDPYTVDTSIEIMKLIEPYLRRSLVTQREQNKLDDEIMTLLVRLAEKASKIGIDTASLLVTGADVYNTFSRKSNRKKRIKSKENEL